MGLAVFIPAIKKNVAFADDLVKKLAGITLVQRAIDKAKEIVPDQDIYVITDSEEICLICKRNNIHYCYEKDLKLSPPRIIENLSFILSRFAEEYLEMVLLSPYAPMLRGKDVQNALQKIRSNNSQLLIPVKKEISKAFRKNKRGIREILIGNPGQELLIESQAFKIISSSLVKKNCAIKSVEPISYELEHDLLEIRSSQDWWVCEKLLRRKRIVFRVVASEKIGMGHIYRALTLAHEITDHEIYFVCDEESRKAVTRLAGNDYWLGVYKENEIVDRILGLKPDLVINDILNTKRTYISRLRAKNVRVINFEDLGTGACYSDATINELYDEIPEVEGKNILWGQKYFFLREEFNEARPHRFKKKVDTLLITFGASDPSDFTRKTLGNILEYCESKKIKIFLVTGGGYPYIKELEKEIKNIPESRVQYIHTTGVMSHIMEQSQIAIAANGRTPYELGHMNIPSIILSHHEREKKHSFATKDRGFLPIGLYNGVKTDKKILASLKKLVEDHRFRKNCFDRIKPFKFQKNKNRVLRLVFELLNN